MKRTSLQILTLLLVLTAAAQQPVKISLVFSSEPQNKAASKLPTVLLEAYRMGDITAYYPLSPDRKVSYEQFLRHVGESGKAQQMLARPPRWFCGEFENPAIDTQVLDCFSQRFEIIERMERNPISQLNEWKQQYVRLLYDATCDPRGFETPGPIFKIAELARLTQDQYRIANPRNEASSYNVYDVLKLRLYSARERK